MFPIYIFFTHLDYILYTKKENKFHPLPDTLSLHCPNPFEYIHHADHFTALYHSVLTSLLSLLCLSDFGSLLLHVPVKAENTLCSHCALVIPLGTLVCNHMGYRMVTQ